MGPVPICPLGALEEASKGASEPSSPRPEQLRDGSSARMRADAPEMLLPMDGKEDEFHNCLTEFEEEEPIQRD